jgi:hypothetical protein
MNIPQEPHAHDVRFLLRQDIYSLDHFWHKLMIEASRTRHGKISSSKQLLECMRQEFIEIVDEIADETVTDSSLFHEVKEVINKNKSPTFVILDSPEKGAAKAVMMLKSTGDTYEAPEESPACKGRRLFSIASPRKKMKKTHYGRNDDITDVEDGYKGLPDSNDRQPNQNETVCQAGVLCRNADVNVVLQGEGFNGSPCYKCQQTFHHVCLLFFEGNMYCIHCYKRDVVSQCSVETLFEDLIACPEKRTTAVQKVRKHTATQLEAFIDNFLKAYGLKMTVREFQKWKESTKEYATTKQMDRKKWTAEERSTNARYLQNRSSEVKEVRDAHKDCERRMAIVNRWGREGLALQG